MAIMLPGHLVSALQYLGYEWPSSNEDVLNAAGDAFTSTRGVVQGAIDDISAAVGHVNSSNSGDASGAFVSYMRGDESNLSCLKDFDFAAGEIATSFHVIAGAVVVLKGVVIAQLVILAAAIASAFISFGIGAGVAVAARAAAKRLIDLAINVAIEKVLFG